LRGAAARTWGEEREGAAKGNKREGGGCKQKKWREERSARVGGGEIVGSHPTDQDLWPKPAPTSAPNPSVKVKKVLLLH
jgi:hypothetical protein